MSDKEKENPNEIHLKQKAAKVSIVEGSACSVMDGFGSRYITPYAIALGMSNAFIGLLSSLPGVIGNLAQLPGSTIINKTSRKKVVFTAVALQAIMWLPLLTIGILFVFFKTSILLNSILLLIVYTLLAMFGAFAGPAWTSWMRDLITEHTDAYFGKRSMICGVVGLVSTFLAGVFLDFFTKFHFILGFGVIFSIALIGRGVSAFMITKQYEPTMEKEESTYFSFVQFAKKMASNNFGKFVIFSAIVSFATAIASPFFSVYMLKNLNFSYVSYMAVITLSSLVALVAMPLWGKLTEKYGNIQLLRICGAFIFVTPFLWLAVHYVVGESSIYVLPYVIAAETLSGFIWAGFNLATSTFVFHAVTKQRIALCSAYSAIITSCGAFLGAALGGYLSSFSFLILGMQPILFVFLLSGILRLVSISFFLPKIKEVREVKNLNLNFKKIFPFIWSKQILQDAGIKRVGFSP